MLHAKGNRMFPGITETSGPHYEFSALWPSRLHLFMDSMACSLAWGSGAQLKAKSAESPPKESTPMCMQLRICWFS